MRRAGWVRYIHDLERVPRIRSNVRVVARDEQVGWRADACSARVIGNRSRMLYIRRVGNIQNFQSVSHESSHISIIARDDNRLRREKARAVVAVSDFAEV